MPSGRRFITAAVDVHDMDYTDGLTRFRTTVSHAGSLTPNCNALCIRVQTQDKQGFAIISRTKTALRG